MFLGTSLRHPSAFALLAVAGLLASTARAGAPSADSAPPGEPAPAASLPAPSSQEGAPILQSPDGKIRIQPGLRLHVDFRLPLTDSSPQADPLRPRIVARRTQLRLGATFFQLIDSDLVVDFGGGGGTRLEHAFINLRPYPWLQAQVGLGKVPMGHEFLVVSSSHLDFVERSLLFTNLHPQYEQGAALHGTLWGGRGEYWAGYFNRQSREKESVRETHDGVARLSLAPVEGLSLAVSGSWGRRHVAKELTWKLATGFELLESGLQARGPRQRVGGELAAYHGPLSFKAEYGWQREALAQGGEPVRTQGLYAAATWVVTGERKTVRGVVPRSPVEPAGGALGLGAWELAARYGRLWGDAALLGGLATPCVREVSLELNWYLTSHVRWMLGWNGYRAAGTATPQAGTPGFFEVLARAQLAF